MKDFINDADRPDREDTDSRNEGQPAYKAFAKDKRTRIAPSGIGERANYRRGDGPSDDTSRDEQHRPRVYGNRRDDRERYDGERNRAYGRPEGGYRAYGTTSRDRNGHDGNRSYGNRYGYGSRDGDERPAFEGRTQADAGGEGQERRRSYNPNFDERNRPVNRSRYNGPRNTEGGYRRSEEGNRDNRYGENRWQSDRQNRYPDNRRREDAAAGDGHDGSNRSEGGKSYGRYGEGERRYEPRKQQGDRPAAGARKNYGNRPGGNPQGAPYGRTDDRKRTARPGGRKPAAPRYDSEHYPTFPAPVIEDKIRLNRYIAMSGICSRREADEFIQSGVVSVNGLVVNELGAKVSQNDEVRFNGNIIRNERKVYIVMNKPKGYVTSVEDPHADKTVMELLKDGCRERVYPVGRLDKNSLGVLLITNDGDMAKKLMHPSYEKKKVYQVSLDKPLTHADMDALVQGFELDDGEIHADAASYVGTKKTEIGIEIHSGRNRIVRRMFEHLGYKVTKLDRVYFAGLTKQRLKRGEWRFLTPREVQALRSGQYE